MIRSARVIANAGTSLGGLCFLAGALLLMPEAGREEGKASAAAPASVTPEVAPS